MMNRSEMCTPWTLILRLPNIVLREAIYFPCNFIDPYNFCLPTPIAYIRFDVARKTFGQTDIVTMRSLLGPNLAEFIKYDQAK